MTDHVHRNPQENRGDPAYAPISTRASIPFEAVVVDDYTIDIVSEERKPLLLGHIFTAGIASMEQLTERRETLGEEPVGTGAWRFVSWERGAGYTIERNPDWWGLNSDDVQHTPDFERVQFLIRPEVSSRIAAVRAGEADFAWDLPAEECFSQLGDNCVEGPSPIVSYVRIDTPHPTLGDPRIKEALAISIDRDTIGQALLGGAPAASQLDVMGALGFIEDLEPFPYDPDRARELIEEAAADGVDVELEISLLGRRASFAGDEQVLEVLQAVWSELGFNISAEMMESAAYNAIYVGGTETYEEGRAALFLLRWPNDLFDAGRTVQSHIFCPGGVNTECQPDLEQRGRAAMALPDAEREIAMQEALREFNKNMDYFMFIPLNELRIFHGVGDRVEWTPRQDLWLYARELQRR
jgi:peptide/nickel transport system substrate-binding protein